MGLNLKSFHHKFPYLDIEETIIYYAIFDGYPISCKIDLTKDFNQIIQKEIIDKIDILKKYFLYDHNMQNQKIINKILTRISRGDRKTYKIYDKESLSQIKGREIFKLLFDAHIIQKEVSREKPFRLNKKQPVKKALRKYRIQDKIHFRNNFTRFWFTFISPLLEKNKKVTIASMQMFFEKYISLEFEKLSNQLIIKQYGNEKILSYGSYWDKDIEIDLLVETPKRKIAGEAKWKNSKICKNILNSLENKCHIANLEINHFTLFSKSGFSKELKSNKHHNVTLYELKDFEILYF